MVDKMGYRELKFDKDSVFLVTGGAGFIGSNLCEALTDMGYQVRCLDDLSTGRKENVEMFMDRSNYTFIKGDIKDLETCIKACEGVDYVLNQAAWGSVPRSIEMPLFYEQNNIMGTLNMMEAARQNGVKKFVMISTDKAVNPVNLYGGTKLVSDKLFIAANAYSGYKDTRFAIVRYGNVAGSRGSVIPFFRNLVESGETELPITDFEMTRFWISLEQGVELVIKALTESRGGETFIAKIPSFKITDLAKAILPSCTVKKVGIREGEKLHEVMITKEDSPYTYEYDKHYIVYPHMSWWTDTKIIPGGKPVEQRFEYSSGTNNQWLSVEDLRELLQGV